jgi:hypothetical protein
MAMTSVTHCHIEQPLRVKSLAARGASAFFGRGRQLFACRGALGASGLPCDLLNGALLGGHL